MKKTKTWKSNTRIKAYKLLTDNLLKIIDIVSPAIQAAFNQKFLDNLKARKILGEDITLKDIQHDLDNTSKKLGIIFIYFFYNILHGYMGTAVHPAILDALKMLDEEYIESNWLEEKTLNFEQLKSEPYIIGNISKYLSGEDLFNLLYNTKLLKEIKINHIKEPIKNQITCKKIETEEEAVEIFVNFHSIKGIDKWLEENWDSKNTKEQMNMLLNILLNCISYGYEQAVKNILNTLKKNLEKNDFVYVLVELKNQYNPLRNIVRKINGGENVAKIITPFYPDHLMYQKDNSHYYFYSPAQILLAYVLLENVEQFKKIFEAAEEENPVDLLKLVFFTAIFMGWSEKITGDMWSLYSKEKKITLDDIQDNIELLSEDEKWFTAFIELCFAATGSKEALKRIPKHYHYLLGGNSLREAISNNDSEYIGWIAELNSSDLITLEQEMEKACQLLDWNSARLIALKTFHISECDCIPTLIQSLADVILSDNFKIIKIPFYFWASIEHPKMNQIWLKATLKAFEQAIDEDSKEKKELILQLLPIRNIKTPESLLQALNKDPTKHFHILWILHLSPDKKAIKKYLLEEKVLHFLLNSSFATAIAETLCISPELFLQCKKIFNEINSWGNFRFKEKIQKQFLERLACYFSRSDLSPTDFVFSEVDTIYKNNQTLFANSIKNTIKDANKILCDLQKEAVKDTNIKNKEVVKNII